MALPVVSVPGPRSLLRGGVVIPGDGLGIPYGRFTHPGMYIPSRKYSRGADI